MKNVKAILKKNARSVALILLVIVAGVVVNNLTKKEKVTPTPIVDLPISGDLTQKKVTKSQKGITTADNGTIDTRAYAEMVLAYKDRTIQFGDSCQVRLSKQVFKVGSDVLLDNRNDLPLVVSIGPDRYSVANYGYKVVTLSSVGEFMIDCNDQQNVAIITVQK